MQSLKYFFVGGVAAATDFSFFLIFNTYFGYHYLVVATQGFVLATLVNYFLSIRWVFTSGARFSKKREIAYVFMVSGIGLGLNILILFLCVDKLLIHPLIAKIIATALVFFWNYYLRKYFVFKPNHSPYNDAKEA
ncbi:MAG: GtrA family protein [Gammaproteobacteria bacterium]|nr:GtrA family protein [Gammaproteobacteria bacterium]